MLTLLPKGVQKIIKTFLIEDLSPQIFEKIWDGPNGRLRGLGEIDSWKITLKSKIPWHCPSKFFIVYITQAYTEKIIIPIQEKDN